jgi:hypothetical protein
MNIYGVAVVDWHGNVGDWFTGCGRESDQWDHDHRCESFQVGFTVALLLVSARIPSAAKRGHNHRSNREVHQKSSHVLPSAFA